MNKVVLLKFGAGNCDIGFHVNLRIRETGKSEIEADGRLNSAPDLSRLYQDWRMVYSDRQIGFRKRCDPASATDASGQTPRRRQTQAVRPRVGDRRKGMLTKRGNADQERERAPRQGSLAEGKNNYRQLTKNPEIITNISVKDSAKALICNLNNWFSGDNEGFRPIREKLLHHLNATDEVRFVISARSHLLWQLPWHLCDLFASYPHADVTLGSLERPLESLVINPQDSIKILVVLGEAKDIDVEADLQVLRDRLPEEAELLEPLVATNFKTLTEALWQNDIDILFFAGHSTSQGQQGCFFLNETDSVEIQELKYALQKAIARGLKLAIFNSCDGVQLARDLADVQMPAVIVMREPIPDEAAQAFLGHFLEAFAREKMPLYRAVREARERLQGLEKKYPYLTWLPVLYQHPEAKDLRWDGMLRSAEAIEPPATLKIFRFPYLKIAVTISAFVVGGWMSFRPLSQYLNKQGVMCLEQYQIECAVTNFNWALRLNPNNASALNNLGLLSESWQEYDLARQYLRESKIKGNPAACNNEARIHILDSKYKTAENLLQFCLSQVYSDVGRYSILKNLGWVFFQQKNYQEAELYLREAIEVKGMRSEGPANCLLAMTLEKKGDFGQVLREWEFCLNSRDNINEERGWKRTAKKRLKVLSEQKK